MKKLTFFLFLLFGFYSFSQVPDIIRQVSAKRNEIRKRLRGYEITSKVTAIQYDKDGKVEDKKSEVKKSRYKGEKDGDDISPLNAKYMNYYNYSVKDNGDEIIVDAVLKKQYSKKDALQGRYVISKKTGYIKEEMVEELNASRFVKSFKMHFKFGEIGEGLYAPVWGEVTVQTKSFFGHFKKIVSTITYTYKQPK